MKTIFTAILLTLCALSCGGRSASGPAEARRTPDIEEPKYYTYRVASRHPHSEEHYTQGLQFADGALLEGTGLCGESAMYRTDLATGRTKRLWSLPGSEFGEGITLLDGKLYQLTWTDNTAHVYDMATGRLLHDFRYPGEGWGLTSDGTSLYMSNGTSRIYEIDPATFRRQRGIEVTLRGEPVEYLNELEWIDGRIWANVYTTDAILIIDPATGRVEGVVDLSGLLPDAERTPQTDVLNGIAHDAATGRTFVTGKRWKWIYEIEIIEK
ncbi:MAG: glutaminyl-peptide cyclotransferase [Alistipes sp.]|nr:glutaminyl-peptide cyclotransferase [Alistipes sp.]